MRKGARIALRAGLSLVALAAAYFALRGLNLREVLEAFRHADVWPVVAATVLGLTLMSAVRIARWAALLAPLPHTRRPTFFDLMHVLSTMNVANNVLPAKAGEAVRAVTMQRQFGFTAGGVIASQLIEKLVEVLSLGLLALAVALFGPVPAVARAAMTVLGLGAVLGIGAAVLVAWRLGGDPHPQHGKIRAFLQRLGGAVRLMRSPHVWAVSVAWSIAVDLCDAAMIGLCLRAVHVDLAPQLWIVLYLAINVAIALPTTPAQVGILEAGATFTLQALGVPIAQGLAFALIYHAIQVIPGTLIGLYSVHHTTRSKRTP